MKTILILALFVAVSFAQFTPKWVSCSGTNEPWQPISVTLSQKPGPNTKETMHACGTVEKDFTVTGFKVTIWSDFTVIYSGFVPLTQQDLPAGTQFCYDYSFYIPPLLKGSYTLTSDLHNQKNYSVGCVTFYVDLTAQREIQ